MKMPDDLDFEQLRAPTYKNSGSPVNPGWAQFQPGVNNYLPFMAKGGSIKRNKKANVAEKGPEKVTNDKTGESAVLTEPTVVGATTDPITVQPLTGGDPNQNRSAVMQPQPQPVMPQSTGMKYGQTAPAEQNQAPLAAPTVNPGATIGFNQQHEMPVNAMGGQNLQAPSMDPLAEQKQKLATAINTPAEKQSGWKQGVWFALQGIRETLNPGSGNLQYLGEAKKQYQVGQLGQNVTQLEALRKQGVGETLDSQKIKENDLRIGGLGADARKDQEAELQRQFAIKHPEIAIRFQNGQLTEKDKEVYNKFFNANAGAFDERTRARTEIGGIQYSAPTTGPDAATLTRVPNAPVNLPQTTSVVTDPKGNQNFTTSDKVASSVMAGTNAANVAQIRNEGLNERQQTKSVLDINKLNATNKAKADADVSRFTNETQTKAEAIQRLDAAIGTAEGSVKTLEDEYNRAGRTEKKAIETKLRAAKSEVSKLQAEKRKVENKPIKPAATYNEIKIDSQNSKNYVMDLGQFKESMLQVRPDLSTFTEADWIKAYKEAAGRGTITAAQGELERLNVQTPVKTNKKKAKPIRRKR